MYAINNPSKPVTYNHNHVVRHEIVTIEETTPPKASEAKTSNKTSDKKYLGRFKITAYCPCFDCCGKVDGITASGTKVREGRTIAVDPKVIPLGSKVEIDGKTYIAEDVGGAIKGNTIDLFFNSHSEANSWGVKYRNVYILED
jgi:3D (Asp-Asp-Asp) domain-containing protein